MSETSPYGSNYEHLEDELRWLDLLIGLKCRTLRLQNQTAAETQVARAAYITPSDVDWLLDDGVKTNAGDSDVAKTRNSLRRLREGMDRREASSLQEGIFLDLPQLCRMFGLSSFERQAMVICLAPELRRKYDRLYAYLQDDVMRKRPSVDLVLELLCDTEPERWSARALLSDGASMLRAGLLLKVNDPHSPSGSSDLAQFLQLDPRICDYLSGNNQVDARLAGQAEFQRVFRDTGEAAVEPEVSAGVFSLVKQHLMQGNGSTRKLVLYLHGPYGVGKRELVSNICRRLGCPLLTIDLELLQSRGAAAEDLMRAAFREGMLQQAVLQFKRADILLQSQAGPLLNALATAVVEYGWLVFLNGESPWILRESFPGCRFQTVALPFPDVPVRMAVWQTCLRDRMPEAAAWAQHLAAQFRLTPGQIRAAVESAENRCLMREDARPLSMSELSEACRQQSNHKLSELAAKIETHYGWSDIVLPAEVLTHLKEICSQARHRYTVFGAWGFNRKLSRGRGLSALFVGPSGTGKTMSVEVLAHELKMDLYKVDLSGVVSKYIGETEKNLARIFSEAETSNAILFFDEADALFGKRTTVSDAHDRYANIETSYLLQKMEDYEGIVILATNLRENMDEAFTRRIRFVVEFPFPDEASRRQIWQTHFPPEAPVSKEIDYGYLAREFQVAGGSIKNIVLNAAFLAAEGGTADSSNGNGHKCAIGMQEILHGARREFAKMGKFWSQQDAVGRGITSKSGGPSRI